MPDPRKTTSALIPQLVGSTSALPPIPVTWELDEDVEIAVQLLGSAAYEAREWVGLNMMLVAVAAGNPGAWYTEFTDPEFWARNNRRHPVVAGFLAGQREGFCSVSGGWAWPTQALADFILPAEPGS